MLEDSNDDSTDILKQTFTNGTGSKAVTCKEIKPKLNVHKVYTTERYIEERKHVEFTRFRLSLHHLKIETGRWARIQKEDRLCECGEVQDEHVRGGRCTRWPLYKVAAVRGGRCTRWPLYEVAAVRGGRCAKVGAVRRWALYGAFSQNLYFSDFAFLCCFQ